MFNAKKFKLTLFTVTSGGLFPGWDKLKNAALDGHEIASHTETHNSLGNMDYVSQEKEYRDSKSAINKEIP